jgi:ATP-binding cassette subfamily C protein
MQHLLDVLGVTTPEGVLLTSCSLLFCAFFIKNIYNVFYIYYRSSFIRRCHAELASKLLGSYLHQDYLFHVEHNSSDLIRNINQDINQIFANLLTNVLLVMVELIIASALLAMMLWAMPALGLGAMAVFGVICVAFYRVTQRQVAALGDKQRQHSAEMIKWTVQGLGAIKETKIMGKEDYFEDSFDEHMGLFSQIAAKYSVIRELPRLFIEVAGIGVMLVITLLMLRGAGPESSILPSLSLFAVSAFRLLPSVNRVTGALSSIRFYIPALNNICADLRSGHLEQREQAQDREALSFEREIELEELWFSYPQGADDVLRGLSLTIRRGETVAFVGSSGAGKTTIADVLLGLLSPARGRVLVDGESIAGARRAWQRHIGYISQPIYLLDDTIRRNVAFGVADEEIDDERLWRALADAQLEETIRALPAGLDTLTGEAGVRLSGGQRQRLGIARVLYRDPSLLVFDEATSALDAVTEQEITAAIDRLHGEKTIVIIAHRLSTVRGCDRIYLLSGGRVVASGSFEELCECSEEFRRMVQLGELERRDGSRTEA